MRLVFKYGVPRFRVPRFRNICAKCWYSFLEKRIFEIMNYRLCLFILMCLLFSINVCSQDIALISSPPPLGVTEENIKFLYIDNNNEALSITSVDVATPNTIAQIDIDQATRKVYVLGLKELVVVDVDMPDDIIVLPLDDSSNHLAGQFLVVNRQRQVRIMSGGKRSGVFQLSDIDLSHSSKEFNSPTKINFLEIQRNGQNVFYTDNYPYSRFSLNIETGKLEMRYGNDVRQVIQEVPEDVLVECRKTEFNVNYNRLALSCANQSWALFSYSMSRSTSLAILFDKTNQTWKSWLKRPNMGSWRLYDHWLVSQHRIYVSNKSEGKFKPTGLQVIRNLSNNTTVEWQTTPDTEILLVHENRVFFIRGNGKGRILFQAQIKDGIIQNETEIVQSELLENVHWALPRL